MFQPKKLFLKGNLAQLQPVELVVIRELPGGLVEQGEKQVDVFQPSLLRHLPDRAVDLFEQPVIRQGAYIGSDRQQALDIAGRWNPLFSSFLPTNPQKGLYGCFTSCLNYGIMILRNGHFPETGLQACFRQGNHPPAPEKADEILI